MKGNSNLFIKSIFTFSLCVFTLSAKASECTYFLSEKAESLSEINLPGKNHDFPREIIDQLPENQQYIIHALHDALFTLDHSEIVVALQNINQPLSYAITWETPEIEIPEELNTIIKSNSHKAEQLLSFYSYFTAVLGTENYNVRTRIGLSMLFSLVPKPKKPVYAIFASDTTKNPSVTKRLIEYFDNLISSPQNANALMNFIDNPYVWFITQKSLNKTLQRHLDASKSIINTNNGLTNLERLSGYTEADIAGYEKYANMDIDKIKLEYQRKKKFSYQSLMQLEEVLARFSEIIINNLNSKISALREVEDIADSIQTIEDMPYEHRRELFETYLAEISGFTSGLEHIVSLLDHLCFGSVMPLKSDQIEFYMHDALKLWLMPIRNQVSQIRTTQKQLIAQQQPKTSTNEVLLKPEWGHSAVTKEPQTLNPNKRKNQNRISSNDNKAIDTGSSSNITLIPYELNLYNYSIFAQKPKSPSDLELNTVYQFRFMREGADSKIQTVEFSKEVLDQFEDSPVAAKFFIRALNLGFARSLNEDGLKILKANRPGMEGRLYELKSMKSGDRLILHHSKGHWKVLKYTDKNNFIRVLQDLI